MPSLKVRDVLDVVGFAVFLVSLWVIYRHPTHAGQAESIVLGAVFCVLFVARLFVQRRRSARREETRP